MWVLVIGIGFAIFYLAIEAIVLSKMYKELADAGVRGFIADPSVWLAILAPLAIILGAMAFILWLQIVANTG